MSIDLLGASRRQVRDAGFGLNARGWRPAQADMPQALKRNPFR